MVKNMVFKDTLAEIYNKDFFFESGKNLQQLAIRNKVPLSICVVDIDDLKVINDTHGKKMGNKIIKEVAQMLQKESRSSDIVGYMGNGQYGLLLYNISGINTNIILDTLRQRVVYHLEKILEGVTISIGACVIHAFMEKSTLDTAYEQAFSALNKAKENGKNRVHIY